MFGEYEEKRKGKALQLFVLFETKNRRRKSGERSLALRMNPLPYCTKAATSNALWRRRTTARTTALVRSSIKSQQQNRSDASSTSPAVFETEFVANLKRQCVALFCCKRAEACRGGAYHWCVPDTWLTFQEVANACGSDGKKIKIEGVLRALWVGLTILTYTLQPDPHSFRLARR